MVLHIRTTVSLCFVRPDCPGSCRGMAVDRSSGRLCPILILICGKIPRVSGVSASISGPPNETVHERLAVCPTARGVGCEKTLGLSTTQHQSQLTNLLRECLQIQPNKFPGDFQQDFLHGG